jgi:pyruvate dehydrogenase E1 component
MERNVKVPKDERTQATPQLAVLPKPETNREWLDSLSTVVEHTLKSHSPGATTRFLRGLTGRLREDGVEAPRVVSSPYINTIPPEKQAPFPGDWEMERRIKSYVRWNAMAMVVNANRKHSGLGGHISTYASAATLYEVAFNHFLRARTGDFMGDMVYFQGHATPGIYARAYLERRWTTKTSIISGRNWLKAEACPPIPILT